MEAHVVAGLLKLYFRELPDPLFTFALYNDIIACHGKTTITTLALTRYTRPKPVVLTCVYLQLKEMTKSVSYCCATCWRSCLKSTGTSSTTLLTIWNASARHLLTWYLISTRLTLKRLLYTLEIIAGSTVTKMTPVNLSIVFAPNLLRCLQETPEIALRDTPAVNRIMKLLIINHSVLLP